MRFVGQKPFELHAWKKDSWKHSNEMSSVLRQPPLRNGKEKHMQTRRNRASLSECTRFFLIKRAPINAKAKPVKWIGCGGNDDDAIETLKAITGLPSAMDLNE